MAVRHRRGLMALSVVLVLAGGAAVVVHQSAAGEPRPEAAGTPPTAPAGTAIVPEAAAVTATATAPAPKPSATRARAVGDAQAAIRRNGAVVRSAPGEKYQPVDAVVDAGGERHVRFARTHRGLDVLGGDFVVHTGANGRFAGATVAQDHAVDVPATAKISRSRAITVAGQGAASRARQVVDAFAGKPALAWEVTAGGHVVIVDATTGTVRRDYDEVHTAESGTGHGLQVGDVPLGTTRRDDGSYALVDPDRGGISVRDALNEYYTLKPVKFAEFTDADDVWGDGTRTDRATAAVDVQYGLARTFDYLRDTFGRAGIRNDGTGLTGYVHHSVDQANASWSNYCECVMFGDGSPAGRPFTSLDVVAHEMAHGLTSHTARLVYSGESGALNEASSDIFGTLVEFAANNPADAPDYLIGEQTGAAPLRRMDEPSRNGKSASCWTPAVKDLDVHRSSGIGGKFFYTLAAGSGVTQWGDSPPCGDAAPVTGLGNDRAAQIWYRALTVYMVSNTNYAGARQATLLAAADLYGPDSTERHTVDAAWLAAGVDGSDAAYGTPELLPFADHTPSPRVGEPVRIQVGARDPQGQPVTFSATGLPPGVSIDAAGLITGAPGTRGEYPSDIIATDPDGNAARELMWWIVKGPPEVRSAPVAMNMQLGIGAFGNYRMTFADAPDHMVDTVLLAVTATGLPDGLDLSVSRPVSGVYTVGIAGIPTTAGAGTTVLTAVDADGERVTASAPWRVLPAHAPAAPLGVRLTGSPGAPLLEWDKPRYTTGDVQVTGYVVRVTPGSTTTLAGTARSMPLTGLDPRKSYTVGIRATSAIGPGAEKTVTLTPAGLPLALSPATIGFGQATVLSGRVVRGGGTIAGAVLTVEQRPAGRTTWSRVTTVRTDAKGAWRATLKPATRTAYRVTYPGATGVWPATSATTTVTVRYTVTVKANTTKTKIYGTAKPARSGVTITLQRRSGTKWVTVTRTRTTASGAYTFSRAFKRGTWTLRVVATGGALNASATSAALKLKVT
ncbi:M4 family metallopeptidase [Actinoplanes awajinensis]|nr:M4 family metallopeptidase [Actinoplanes awajinensis]